MDTMIDRIAGTLDRRLLRPISTHIGTDEATTRSAIRPGVQLIVAVLARFAQGPGGASALHAELSGNYTGGLLDDVSGFIRRSGAQPGHRILESLLEGEKSSVERCFARRTGLKSDSARSLLAILTPVVLAWVGRFQRYSRLDSRGLETFLVAQRVWLDPSNAPGEATAILGCTENDPGNLEKPEDPENPNLAARR